MNLYLIERIDKVHYDEYDSLVVAAESEDIAKTIHPNYPQPRRISYDSWTTEDKLEVTLIGITDVYKETTVVHSSFNAG